jgi:hypothetical protein
MIELRNRKRLSERFEYMDPEQLKGREADHRSDHHARRLRIPMNAGSMRLVESVCDRRFGLGQPM